jgi:hypothetical protein
MGIQHSMRSARGFLHWMSSTPWPFLHYWGWGYKSCVILCTVSNCAKRLLVRQICEPLNCKLMIPYLKSRTTVFSCQFIMFSLFFGSLHNSHSLSLLPLLEIMLLHYHYTYITPLDVLEVCFSSVVLHTISVSEIYFSHIYFQLFQLYSPMM